MSTNRGLQIQIIDVLDTTNCAAAEKTPGIECIRDFYYTSIEITRGLLFQSQLSFALSICYAQ